MRQNRRAFWENRAEWGGETTPKEWGALTKLLYASGEKALKDFEEFLDLCTKGEDGWRILVHVAPHVPGVSPDDIRVLLIDWAATGPSGHHAVRVIVRKLYLFMLEAASRGDEELAQKLRLGTALLVHRHIAVSGPPTFMQFKLYNYPEFSPFPSERMTLWNVEHNKFKFLENESQSKTGIILRLYERSSSSFFEFDLPEEKEIVYMPNVLFLAMQRCAKYGDCFDYSKTLLNWAIEDPTCQHLMKTGRVAWLGTIKIRFQRAHRSFFEKLLKKKWWNEFFVPLIRETSGAEDQLMQVVSELIPTWDSFNPAIDVMKSTFNLSEDRIKAAREKRDRKQEFLSATVDFVKDKPWGNRVDAPACFEFIPKFSPIIVLDYNFELGPTMRKLENKIRRTPLDEGWGPVGTSVQC